MMVELVNFNYHLTALAMKTMYMCLISKAIVSKFLMMLESFYLNLVKRDLGIASLNHQQD